MSEEAITSETVESGAEEAQLDNTAQNTEAVTNEEDTSQASETDEAESSIEDDSEDTELKEWAAKKNLPLDDPIKLAKMYRESEQKLGKKGQQEGQLRSAVETASSESGADGVQALNNRITALEFYINHPDAKQFEDTMVTILEEKPWMANDLDLVLDAARGRNGSQARDLAAAKQTGSKEALAQAEKANRAAPPSASATNAAKAGSNRITPENVDDVIGRHMGDTKWYKSHEAEINAALAT